MTDDRAVRKLKNRITLLHEKRGAMQAAVREQGKKTTRLTEKQKEEIARQTGYKCHCCGKRLIGENHKRQFDHVRAKSTGGHESMRNFLMACDICNMGRKAKLPEEIHLLLALGEFARRAILNGTALGDAIAQAAVKRDAIKSWLKRPIPRY